MKVRTFLKRQRSLYFLPNDSPIFPAPISVQLSSVGLYYKTRTRSAKEYISPNPSPFSFSSLLFSTSSKLPLPTHPPCICVCVCVCVSSWKIVNDTVCMCDASQMQVCLWVLRSYYNAGVCVSAKRDEAAAGIALWGAIVNLLERSIRTIVTVSAGWGIPRFCWENSILFCYTLLNTEQRRPNWRRLYFVFPLGGGYKLRRFKYGFSSQTAGRKWSQW